MSTLSDIKYQVLFDMLVELLSIEESFCKQRNLSLSVECEIIKQVIDRPSTEHWLKETIRVYGIKLTQRGLYNKSEEEIEIDIDRRINRSYNISRLL